jgi:hypothetical protein
VRSELESAEHAAAVRAGPGRAAGDACAATGCNACAGANRAAADCR